MIEEDLVQKVGRMRQEAKLGGLGGRKIVSGDQVLRHHNLPLEMVSVGPVAQPHRQVIQTKVGAVAGADDSANTRVFQTLWKLVGSSVEEKPFCFALCISYSIIVHVTHSRMPPCVML